MRILTTILALAVLLCIPPQPTPSGLGSVVYAESNETPLPELRAHAQNLAQRVAEAEQRFRAAIVDLERLDIPQAAWELDWELCLIVDAGLRLEALARARDRGLADLVDVALWDARRARERMEAVESLGSTAHAYMRLLREMRTAYHRGDLQAVLELYAERRSNSLPEQWPQPVRRILMELDGLRVEVALLLLPAAPR